MRSGSPHNANARTKRNSPRIHFSSNIPSTCPPRFFATQAPPHASTDHRAGCLFILHPFRTPLSSPEKAPEFAVTVEISCASRMLMLSPKLALLVKFSLISPTPRT